MCQCPSKHPFTVENMQLANMKPYVDCSSPKVYPHLQQRLKKYVAEEYRMALIQRDNYTLITKMAAIMQGKGTLDNWNNYRIMRWQLMEFLAVLYFAVFAQL